MIKLEEFMAYRNQEDCDSTCSADSFLTTDTRMSDLTSIDVQTAQNNERAMRESIRQLNEQLQALKLENDRLRESQDSAQAELSDLHNELRREKSGSVAPKSALRSSTSRAADNDTFIIGEQEQNRGLFRGENIAGKTQFHAEPHREGYLPSSSTPREPDNFDEDRYNYSYRPTPRYERRSAVPRRVVIKEPICTLPTFDGNGSLRQFQLQFQDMEIMNGWDSDDVKVLWLKQSLRGKARDILYDACYDIATIWNRLEARFGEHLVLRRYEKALPSRKRQQNETLGQLADDIRRMSSLVYADIHPTQRERLTIQHFVEALDQPAIQYDVKQKSPVTLDEALEIATTREMFFGRESGWGNNSPKQTYSENRKPQPRNNEYRPAPAYSQQMPMMPNNGMQQQQGAWGFSPNMINMQNSLPTNYMYPAPQYPSMQPGTAPASFGPPSAYSAPPSMHNQSAPPMLPQNNAQPPMMSNNAPPPMMSNAGPPANMPTNQRRSGCKHCGGNHPSFVCRPCKHCNGPHYDNKCPGLGREGNSQPISSQRPTEMGRQ